MPRNLHQKRLFRWQFASCTVLRFHGVSTVPQHVCPIPTGSPFQNDVGSRHEQTRYNRRRGRARGRHRGVVMSPDEAVALSFAFLSDLPRAGLTDRLRADDPNLLELARALLGQAAAVRAAATRRGI